MAISDSLNITKISDDNNTFCFDCTGSIDVNAKGPLASLSCVPAKAHVILEFKKIERVNSMGLSLLLKIFEEWEKQQITVEVKDLNRMVNMLFKITGLGRFVAGNTDAKTGDKKSISPQAPIHVNAKKDQGDITEKFAAKKKLNFVASLQTGQQLTGWYLFNTYLQRHMQKAIHFDQAQDMLNAASVDILFAKPFEACTMIKKRGFVPIMRPIAEADEVVILTRADDERSLSDFNGASVVTASENSFVYILGRFLCDENELDSATFKFSFSGNEIKSLQMLIRKKADLLFMLKKTYEGLSSFSKKNVRKLDESATDFAFHLFSIAPNLVEEGKALHTILAEMAADEKGKRILEDIEFQGWCPVEEGELKMLTMVFDRYVTDS